MRIREHPAIAAAVLLAGLASAYSLLGVGDGWQQAMTSRGMTGSMNPSAGSGARIALEWCRENVSMIHDVHWANACSTHAEQQRARQLACLRAQTSAPGAVPCDADAEAPDDSPDCTLPDALAQPLNLARARAEQACLVEATTAVYRGAGPAR
jgi:hypothetical protein